MAERSRRVLIAMSDAGGGHRAVSRALASALEQRHQADVRIVDVVALDPRGFPHRMVRLYPWVIRHAPLLNGIAYHSTNLRRLYSAISQHSSERLTPPIVDLLHSWEPAAVVTAHPFCNRAILDAVGAVEMDLPVIAAVTELVSVHVSWVDQRIRRYLVAGPEAFGAVVKHGAPPPAVSITGLPLAPAFARERWSPADLRRALNLDPSRFTVLLIGGGEGAGRLAAQVRSLDRSKLDLQLIVVCGRNARLRARLSRGSLRHRAAIFGFVDTMPQLMQAADVVVTKGGPTTIVEAFVSGRPVVVTAVLPGQEEGNDRFVERNGVGLGAHSRRSMVAAVSRLARDQDLRLQMSERAATLFPVNAASNAADIVVAEAGRAGRWLEMGAGQQVLE